MPSCYANTRVLQSTPLESTRKNPSNDWIIEHSNSKVRKVGCTQRIVRALRLPEEHDDQCLRTDDPDERVLSEQAECADWRAEETHNVWQGTLHSELG